MKISSKWRYFRLKCKASKGYIHKSYTETEMPFWQKFPYRRHQGCQDDNLGSASGENVNISASV